MFLLDGITGTGNENSSQYVYATGDNYFSPNDLFFFEVSYGLPFIPATSVGDHSSDSFCSNSPNNCLDANLNVQYTMSTSPYTPTTFYYDNSTDFIVSWIVKVLTLPSIPNVILISYGVDESTITYAHKNSFDAAAKALAVMGVTIVVRSGDDGAPGTTAALGVAHCSYAPIWPASSPYVLVVGATQGPEIGSQEVTCASNAGGLITSGGGFSNLYEQPSWQADAVNDYFDAVIGSVKEPSPGYNASGRAYPDISMIGANFLTIVGNDFVFQYSTASYHVIAIFIVIVIVVVVLFTLSILLTRYVFVFFSLGRRPWSAE